ncbi:MAG TPA: ABC transporter permease subunit [Acidimicrobiales bacterium]|nr:ABC transporter permease subunit [Acidimicrobiales bacterium]
MAGAAAALSRPVGRRGREDVSLSRRARNLAWWSLAGVALALLVVPVVWVLYGVFQQAVPNWHWSIFTEVTTGVGGGLANALAGTGVLLLGVGVLVSVIGIGCGLYLAEFAPTGALTTLLRSASEILSGVPSIVIGYVGYVALVVGLHWGFSLLAALIVLTVLVIPYVSKATEIAIGQVPVAYREGAEALGMARSRALRTVVLRSAIPGIATGIIVALAISVGETAPLLYTAGFSNSFPTAQLVHSAVPYLTYATWTFYDDPSAAVKALAFDSMVLLVVLVLALILASRLVVWMSQKHSPARATGGGVRRAGRGRAGR